jgi:erythromycin esterase
MKDVRDWISTHAIALATVEPNRGFADLEPLRRIIGTARILSLGEATHGSREFFQLKHRLLEFAVAELGFTIFALEANFTECLRINNYVLGGRGSAADVLSGTRFWTWDTEEVLALIEWMRDWNSTHARQVSFYGYDMQFPTEPALATLDYLRCVAPDLYEASAEHLDALCDDLSSEHFRLRDATLQKQVLDTIDYIRTVFDQERTAWVAATSTREWQLARLNAVVLAQSARLRLPALAAQVASRDLAMAENVVDLLALEGEQSKAVLWAHNGHVREGELVQAGGRYAHCQHG